MHVEARFVGDSIRQVFKERTDKDHADCAAIYDPASAADAPRAEATTAIFSGDFSGLPPISEIQSLYQNNQTSSLGSGR